MARNRGRTGGIRGRAWRAVVAVVITLVAVVGAEVALSVGRVHPGVHVSGVAVGGMSRQDALQRLQAPLAEEFERPVTVRHGARSWRADAKTLGVRANAGDAVARAYAMGRRGGFVSRVGERLAAWVGHADVDADALLEESALRSFVASIASDVDTRPSDASVVIEGTRVRVVGSSPGARVRRERAAADLGRAFAARGRIVELPVEVVPVRVTDADAAAAAEQAERMLCGEVRLVHSDRSWTFEPETIAGWIAFRAPVNESSESSASQGATTPPGGRTGMPRRSSARLEARVAPSALAASLEDVIEGVGRPAKDAGFKVVKGGKIEITGSEVGLGLDATATAADMGRTLEAAEERVAPLRLMQVQPRRTTEQAERMGVRERIGHYTTMYASGARSRVNNIHLLARTIDGELVGPGETFSLNGAVGPRTAAKGYKEAPAIVNGRLLPQLGGGICQVGTTVFNSVFFAGLPVVERRNHSFYISHYPVGRDATVSWGGPDLKFRNDTGHWLMIDTYYTSSSLSIDLYGTDPGLEVSYTTSDWSDARPFVSVTKTDPSLPAGVKVIEDGGVRGGEVTVVRKVTKDGRLVRKDAFVSRYRPKDEIVRIGAAVSQVQTQTP